jgi:hypothetical protein
MKAISLEDLHRRALEVGAEVHDSTGVFNSTQAVVARDRAKIQHTAPASAETAPSPVAPPEPSLKLSDVLEIIRQRDVSWQAQLDALRASIVAGIPVPPPPPEPPQPPTWKFSVDYDTRGILREIVAVPQKKIDKSVGQ